MKNWKRSIKRVVDKTLGTFPEETFWRFRHFLDRGWVKSYISQNSINHPHRKILVEKISAYAPFETILEVGCATGSNLYLLAKKFPEATLYGIDISRPAIATGKQWFKEQGINNVFLSQGKLWNLKNFADKSIDVVFTDAVLIYVGPRKIETAVKELVRVAKKALLLIEWYDESKEPLYRDQWVYNYKDLLNRFLPGRDIILTKITKEMWSGGQSNDWAKYGYIIEVRI